jgi:hypothetical protein
MSLSPKLGVPLIEASQAQKHATHNEGVLMLEALLSAVVLASDLTIPPASPEEGDLYIVPAGASGLWQGEAGRLALFLGGAWSFTDAAAGFEAFDATSGNRLQFLGGMWRVTASYGAAGARSANRTIEAEVALSGASVATGMSFPDRSIMKAVSVEVLEEITGADSYDCGIAGEADKFGGTLGIDEGSRNVGVIGPVAIYQDTEIILTANGGSFTGGRVRLAMHFEEFDV